MVGENTMVLVMMQLELDWVTHPFINEHPTPHYGLPHNLYKNISNSPIFQFFGSPYPLPFVNGVGVETMYLPLSRKLNI